MASPSPNTTGIASSPAPHVTHQGWLFCSRLLKAVRNRVWYHRELRVYSFPLADLSGLPHPIILERDCFDDLRYYERSTKEQQPPHLYRKMALERMAEGFHLYTLVEHGRLLHYAWLIERQTRGEDAWVDQVYFPPPDTAVLFDHFTHPSARGRGLYFQALCQLLHDARDLTQARQAYVTVFGNNGPSRHVIEKVGFQHEGSLCKERRLLWSRRYAVASRQEFKTAML
jgi:RimJ/RimL family protein N-acetyltransferase